MSSYEKQTWVNGAAGGTPLSADRLNHIEDGISGVADEQQTGRLSADSIQLVASTEAESSLVQSRSLLQFGARFGFQGDSITAMSPVNWSRSTGYVASAAMEAKGKFKIVADTAVAGTTTTDILARIDSDLDVMQVAGVQTVMNLFGTNDAGQSIPLATTQSNVRQIIDKEKERGFAVVIGTIPPTDNTTPVDRKTRVALINEWYRQLAAQERLVLVDFFTSLVDPTTGGYLSGLGNGDAGGNIHPSHAGGKVMASTFLNTLSPYLPSMTARVSRSVVDPLNLYGNPGFGTWSTPISPGTLSVARADGSTALAAGTYYYKVGLVNLFGESVGSNEASIVASAGDTVTLTIPLVTGQKRLRIYRSTSAGSEVLLDDVATSGSGNFTYADNGSKTPGTTTPRTTDSSSAPTGISNNSSTTPVSIQKVTDAEWPLPMMRLRPFEGTNAIVQSASLGASGVINAGDYLAVAVPVRGGGSQFTLKVQLRNSSNVVLQTLGLSAMPAAALGTDLGLFYTEIQAPANFNNMYFILQADDNVGWVDWGAPSVFNLTQNGTLENS